MKKKKKWQKRWREKERKIKYVDVVSERRKNILYFYCLLHSIEVKHSKFSFDTCAAPSNFARKSSEKAMKAYEKAVKRHEKKRAVPFNISLFLSNTYTQTNTNRNTVKMHDILSLTRQSNKILENPQYYLIWSFERTKTHLCIPHSRIKRRKIYLVLDSLSPAHVLFFLLLFWWGACKGNWFFACPLYETRMCDGVKIACRRKKNQKRIRKKTAAHFSKANCGARHKKIGNDGKLRHRKNWCEHFVYLR